ncbi:hypothetical protein H0H87_003481 [Tephrocybe sp. NHM501043]|nr:hypothetical protein H0H87_003481 [Tephrocybe sp. NHM501043]
MAPKRRILVVYEQEHPAKRVKLAVSVDKDATNDALARKIAENVGSEQVKLEIGDGFELHGQDGVEMILDSDVVIARPSQPHGPFIMSTSQLPTLVSTPNLDQKEKEGEEHNRYQIRLITAELARAHAKETLKESTEPTNGILAFDGQFVSGNTTLSALRQQAVSVLGWKPFGESFEDEPCHHEARPICSCPIAQEVELYGLSSTLHCRFTVDGTACLNDECCYSHVALSNDGNESLRADAPHCSLCGDALAFPCPSCLKHAERKGIEPSAVVHCAIIQNAGCGHMHHAHCLGPKKDVNGCPSGCSAATTHREPIPFDQDAPTITLVWDADRIERLPIPSHFLDVPGSMQNIPTEVLVSIVESFLKTQSVDLNGLSLRLHGRDPNSEIVRFVWTTLVSLCTSSLHKNLDHRRFSFSMSTLPSPAAPMTGKKQAFEIDFHTSSCPVVVCGCTRLKDILPRNTEHCRDTQVTLYAVKRTCEKKSVPTSKHTGIPISKQSVYQFDDAWQPSMHQTPRGMAALLSSLHVLSEVVRQKGVVSENRVLAALYSVTRFPPAVRALGMLMLNIAPQPHEKAALSEALFHALRDFSQTASMAFTINTSRRFETVRILLGHILTITDVVNVIERPLQSFSLICGLSNKRLVDPVLFGADSVVERSAGTLHAVGGLLFRPTNGAEPCTITELNENQLRKVVAQSKEFKNFEIYILLVHELGVVTRPVTLENAGRDFPNSIQKANETDLISRGPLELKSPSVVPPQIVLDSEGLLAVFTGRGCGATRDVNFFRPLSGGDTEVDVNDVEHALQRIIAARKVEDTWDVDCFGGIPAKARTPDEAIVLCLDLSQSMNEKSAVGQSDAPSIAFNHKVEGERVINEAVKGLSDDAILENASRSQTARISRFLDVTLDSHELSAIVGEAPYDIPRDLVDPVYVTNGSYFQKLTPKQLVVFCRTGDLLKTAFNIARRNRWVSAALSTVHSFRLLMFLETSGQDILDGLKSEESDTVTITLKLIEPRIPVVWQLPKSTSTRILYSLVNRATEAEYGSFELRDCDSMEEIEDSADLLLSSTELRMGGTVEVDWTAPHRRKPLKFRFKILDEDEATVLLPSDASALALISSVRRLDVADKALLKQELTPIFENFRLELDKVRATGDTAMIDALDLARSCLVNFRRDLPNLRRRIIIVSDGEDTCSDSLLTEVGSALQRDQIVVDSVQVGRELSDDLHTVSAATGGYRFFPKTSLGDALSIFDLETMMNSAERPTRPKMSGAFSQRRQQINIARNLFPIDVVTVDKFPERAQHPKLAEPVKDVKQAAAVSLEALNSERTRRIMRELKAINADPHPQIDVYVNGDDMSFLKVIIQAPDDIGQCPYKGGCFLLTCDLPADYPRDPPEIRFVTFILHPNVSKQGKVCVAELSRLWSSDIMLKELLSLIYGLLLEPDLDNPLEIQASLRYYDDDGTFALAAAKAVSEHASKSRSEWREELDV